jgi:hypothetical protein
MSNVKQGLAALRAHQEEQKAKEEARNRPKADWFSSVFPKKLGDSATVRFLQELDADAPGYNAERGLAVIAVEHQAPGEQGFRRRALCTIVTEGQCYACERHKQDYKAGWKQRTNFYVNVLVEVDGEKKVYILSRNANANFTDAIIQEAVDEGGITDANYRLTKTGTGTQTNWLVKRLKGDPMEDAGVEVYDLNEVALRAIPYENQAEYYGAVFSDAGSSDEGGAPASSSTTVDEEW